MRKFIAAVSTACLLTTGAMADVNSGALAPGKPAGLKAAELDDTTLLLVAGIAVIAIIAVAASGGGGQGSASGGSPVTSGTG